MPHDMRTGIVTDDPAKTAPNGTLFQFRSMHYRPIVPRGAGAIEAWDHFGSTLVGISFVSDGRITTEGSAVLIGPGLAMAAKHVFEPLLPQIMSEAIKVTAFSITANVALIWRVVQIVMADTDLVLLRLDLASDFPEGGLNVATLTTRSPQIGEPVMFAGFRSAEPSAEHTVETHVRIAVGEVSAVYSTGRDSVMLPHPTVEVKCLTVGGMSGGPAFDTDGNLLGILTSSFEYASGDNSEGPSYLTLWWPLAATQIQSCWPPGFIPLPTSLLALNKARGLSIVRPEAVRVIADDQLEYSPWH